MRTDLIVYECVAAAHQPTLMYPDKLTIHADSWAFCPFDAHADGHEWRETGGIAFNELLRRAGIALAQPSERRSVAEETRTP